MISLMCKGACNRKACLKEKCACSIQNNIMLFLPLFFFTQDHVCYLFFLPKIVCYFFILFLVLMLMFALNKNRFSEPFMLIPCQFMPTLYHCQKFYFDNVMVVCSRQLMVKLHLFKQSNVHMNRFQLSTRKLNQKIKRQKTLHSICLTDSDFIYLMFSRCF